MKTTILTMDIVGYEGYYGSIYDATDLILNRDTLIKVDDIPKHVDVSSYIYDLTSEYLPTAYGDIIDLKQLVEEWDMADFDDSEYGDRTMLDNQVKALKHMFNFMVRCKQHGIKKVYVMNGILGEENENSNEYQGEDAVHFIPKWPKPRNQRK